MMIFSLLFQYYTSATLPLGFSYFSELQLLYWTPEQCEIIMVSMGIHILFPALKKNISCAEFPYYFPNFYPIKYKSISYQKKKKWDEVSKYISETELNKMRQIFLVNNFI